MDCLNIQIPSVRPSILETLRTFDEHFADPFAFSFTVHGRHEPEVEKEVRGHHRVIDYIPQADEARPSMSKLRRAMNVPGQELWMALDDDARFTEGSERYYSECVKAVIEAREDFGRPIYLGTDGAFGSRFHGDRIHLSRTNSLMPNGKGLIFCGINFAGERFDFMDRVEGGLEDFLFCCAAIEHFNAVPLKRFLNPTKNHKSNEEQRKSSFIHDYDVWMANAVRFIRQMSGEYSWVMPIGMGDKGPNKSKCPRPYIRRTEALMKEFPKYA